MKNIKLFEEYAEFEKNLQKVNYWRSIEDKVRAACKELGLDDLRTIDKMMDIAKASVEKGDRGSCVLGEYLEARKRGGNWVTLMPALAQGCITNEEAYDNIIALLKEKHPEIEARIEHGNMD